MPRTFDPARHGEGGSAAQLSEGADAAAGVVTAYQMAPGDSFIGSLSSLGDRDWVAVTLTAGQTYTIDLSGQNGGGGTLADPYLRLYDSTGALIGVNDDGSSSGLDSELSFTAPLTGAYNDNYTGTYTLAVSSGSTGGGGGTVGTLDEMADFLIDGYWPDGPRSFDTSSSNILTVNLTGLTAQGQQLARWALEAWEMVTNLVFVETTGTADIDFDDDQPGAFAGSSYTLSGDIISSYVNVDVSWIAAYGAGIGSYTFSTYVHEIGHALGLGHQGDYDGSASYPGDATFTNDSYQLSIMSYFSQTDNSTVVASYAQPVTPMIVDIIAVQSVYGAPGAGSVTSGDTVWGEGASFGNYLDILFNNGASYSGDPVTLTVYDRDGTDLINLPSSTEDNLIDMRPEGISNVNGLIGNVIVARGTVLENAILGSGNDTVIGNTAANDIHGGLGNDSLLGGAGFDTLEGGGGNDVVNGEGGADSLYGGDNNDLVIGGSGFDWLFGGTGNDTLVSGSEPDRAYGGSGDDVIRLGTNVGISVDGGFGEAGNDRIFGEGGYDVLRGGDDNDWLDGGDQADNLYGDAGDDTLIGGQGLDRLFGGTGNDLLEDDDGPGGFFGEDGDDTMNGGDDIGRYFGGSGNDLIRGFGGDDTISGNAGFDTIDAGSGNDSIRGNFNADTFVFEDGHGQDTIHDFEALNDLEKIDFSGLSTINSLADLDLGSAVNGAATQVGANVLIDSGGGNTILLVNVNIGDLDANDFIF